MFVYVCLYMCMCICFDCMYVRIFCVWQEKGLRSSGTSGSEVTRSSEPLCGAGKQTWVYCGQEIYIKVWICYIPRTESPECRLPELSPNNHLPD